jgi:hypothetical protein
MRITSTQVCNTASSASLRDLFPGICMVETLLVSPSGSSCNRCKSVRAGILSYFELSSVPSELLHRLMYTMEIL